MLKNWVSTKEGERVKCRLFEIFQTSLAPEELALVLTNMMILWNLDPPDEEDVSSPLPPNLLGLANLLSMPSTLKQSFSLLLELFRSFCEAVKCSVKENNVPIMQLLKRAISGDEYTSVNEELWEYSMQRLKGKCQREVAIDASFEQLAGGLSLSCPLLASKNFIVTGFVGVVNLISFYQIQKCVFRPSRIGNKFHPNKQKIFRL